MPPELCIQAHGRGYSVLPACPEGFEFYDTNPKLQNEKNGRIIGITEHKSIEEEDNKLRRIQLMCAEKCIDDIFCNLFQVTLDYCVTYALKTISTSPHYGSAEKFYKGFCENRCDYLANFVTSCKKTCSDNSCTASITRGQQQNNTYNIQTRAPSPNEFRMYKSESTYHSWKLAWNNLHKIPIYSFFWIKQWDGEKQVRTDFYNDDGLMTGTPIRRYYHAKYGAPPYVAYPNAISTPTTTGI